MVSGLSEDQAESLVGVAGGSNRKRKAGALTDGLGEAVDQENLRKARKVVIIAMKDAATAVRLAYIVESGKLTTKKENWR